MSRKSMEFFAKTREHAEKYVEKIKHDYEMDTGRHAQGNLRLAGTQRKHDSGWKTWKW